MSTAGRKNEHTQNKKKMFNVKNTHKHPRYQGYNILSNTVRGVRVYRYDKSKTTGGYHFCIFTGVAGDLLWLKSSGLIFDMYTPTYGTTLSYITCAQKPKNDTDCRLRGMPRSYTPFYLFMKPPHAFYIRLTHYPDWDRSIVKRGSLHSTPQLSHRLVATLFPPSLESINCDGHAVVSCAASTHRCYVQRPSMTRAAGLVARRFDHLLSSRLSDIPVCSN